MQIHLIIVCCITVLVTFSNVLSIALLVYVALDPYSALQGIDYCIFSLAISDLINGILIGSLSAASIQSDYKWIFGETLCVAIGYLSYTLFAVNVNSIFWLAVDRFLYITDYRYGAYQMRTRTRCICKIIFSWIIAALFCLAPAMVHGTANYLTIPSICTINWLGLEAYYTTVMCILFMPCFLATIYIFVRIFIWRTKYRRGWYYKHNRNQIMTAARAENLLNPTHRMAFILVLTFWLSWLPYGVHILRLNVFGPIKPDFTEIWTGFSQGIWKLPIMIGFCPRYRNYFAMLFHLDRCSCCSNKCKKTVSPTIGRFTCRNRSNENIELYM